MGLPAFKESEEFFAQATPVKFAVRDIMRPEDLQAHVKQGELKLRDYRATVGRRSTELRSSSRTVFELASKAQLIQLRLDLLGHIVATEAILREHEASIAERILSIDEFDAEIASSGKPRQVRRFFHQLNQQVVAQLHAHLTVARGYLTLLTDELLADVDRRLRALAANAPALKEAVADLEARYPVVAAYLAR